MHYRETLPVSRITDSEVRVVSQAWVAEDLNGAPTTTVSRLRATLSRHGIAVISGSAGSGRSGAALRALWEESETRRGDGKDPLELQSIIPDWDKPSLAVLPTQDSTGYILDVSNEASTWENPEVVAQFLVNYGSGLLAAHSAVVVIVTEKDWRSVSLAAQQVLVKVVERPSPFGVVVRHLSKLYNHPERATWITEAEESYADLVEPSTAREAPAESGARDRESIIIDKNVQSRKAILAHLIRDDTNPQDAATLAMSLSESDGSDVSLERISDEFRRWTATISRIFEGSSIGAEGRATLIAASVLEGAPAVTVQSAARQLIGDNSIQDAASVLAGPDMKSRFQTLEIGIRDRRVTFDAKPGLSSAVLSHVWEHRIDFRDFLLKWIARVTRPEAIAFRHLDQVGKQIVALAIEQADQELLAVILDWAKSESIAENCTEIPEFIKLASESPELGPYVRSLLLEWSQNTSDPKGQLPFIVASVCSTSFSQKFPRQALVRLRWILLRAVRDRAVSKAEDALRQMAADPRLLPRVWQTVVHWILVEKNIAGRRAFLSIVDPNGSPQALQLLLEAASKDDKITEGLTNGWILSLQDESVNVEATSVLRGWAKQVWLESPAANRAYYILDAVFSRHLAASPVAALLYGEPGAANEPEIVQLRKRLFSRRFGQEAEAPRDDAPSQYRVELQPYARPNLQEHPGLDSQANLDLQDQSASVVQDEDQEISQAQSNSYAPPGVEGDNTKSEVVLRPQPQERTESQDQQDWQSGPKLESQAADRLPSDSEL